MKEKIQSLNGLRGISCFMILLYHYRFFLLNCGFNIIDYGYYFVEVFMTLSGFLIAYNYSEEMQKVTFQDFLLKRYLKIMPLFWITELFMHFTVVIANILSGERISVDLGEEILRYTGLGVKLIGNSIYPRNNPLWTISSLLLCYFIYYIIVKITRVFKCRVLYSILNVMSLIVLLIIFSLHVRGKILINTNMLWSMLSFFVGVLLYKFYMELSRYREILSWSFLFLTTILGIILALYGSEKEATIALYVCFFLCPCFLYCSLGIPLIKKLLESKLLQKLGAISMDLYMWHWVVRVYLGSRPVYIQQETLSGFLILIVIALLMAIFSHYVIMKRLNRIIKNINKIK